MPGRWMERRATRGLPATAAIVLAAMALAGTGLVAPRSASAAVACTYDPLARQVAATLSGANDSGSLIRDAAGAILLNSLPCGSATVTNTNRITILGAAGRQVVSIGQNGLRLAPGATTEATGLSEIEISIDLGADSDSLTLHGTGGVDWIALGSEVADLNTDGDVDVAWSGIESRTVEAWGGNDRILATGAAGGPAATVAFYLRGGAGNDVIAGGAAADVLDGADGADSLSGGGGDDTLQGGAANDVLAGGAGVDTVSYADHVAPVVASLDGIANDGSAGETDSIAGVENLRGTTVADILTGSDGANRLMGDAGADVLNGLGGPDTMIGGLGADAFNGGAGADTVSYEDRAPAYQGDSSKNVTVTIDGLANDGVVGEGDNVKLDVENVTGGAGSDSITGSAAANVLNGGASRAFGTFPTTYSGADLLRGGGGTDTLYGGPANDTLQGDAGGDRLFGEDGADALFGGDDGDTLDGGAGCDTTLSGGAGADTMTYASRTVPLAATLDGVANDGPVAGECGGLLGGSAWESVSPDVESLIGGSANDTLTGSGANNVLVGGAGNDVLGGLDGNDVLEGGLGADVMNGGAGIDRVTYGPRVAAVTANLDGLADDGEAGELDRIAVDVENLVGGSGPDVLVGSAAANSLDGGPGKDSLAGLGGPDTLTGGAGADAMSGGDANDTFYALDGVADTLNGGPGSDRSNRDPALDVESSIEVHI